MNWKDYEIEIYNQFKEIYPNAEISHNVMVPGRYSKVERQIDILIEEYVVGSRIRIIVDGKFFSKKIDVKDVEMFIGMLKDCDAKKGLLITQEGFSKAAINRAHFDPSDVELDILNFKDLSTFQGFEGIPYSGKHGVFLPAPFGWILDITKHEGFLATIYQRGLSLDQAMKNNEWMYINIKSKDDEIKSLDDFLKLQQEITIEYFSNANFEMLPTVKRDDAKIKLRVIDIKSYPTKEYTGFVEFEEFIFFCVLFTSEELKQKNIRKLESILQRVIPIEINHKQKGSH